MPHPIKATPDLVPSRILVVDDEVDAFLRVIESGRLAEVTQHDGRAREGVPGELAARALQPIVAEGPG